MPARRVNPYLVKRTRSYTTSELAARLGVHKNTVRLWKCDGLEAIDDSRPTMFHGEAVRMFLIQRNTRRKRPCPPGTLYCFRCREARQPVPRTVEYLESKPGTGNLRALCETCDTVMHRGIRRSALATVMPGISVQIREAPLRLSGGPGPPLNCVKDDEGAS
jgi:hypothetical protein